MIAKMGYVTGLLTLAAAGWLGLATPAEVRAEVTITGAGATFPAPIYTKWADEYGKATGVKLNYQAIGSGGGITQIKNKTVDFGASDAPLKPEELDAAGLTQFPAIMGGDVAVVNVPGIASNQLKLGGETLAKIFLGEITKWNDAAIKADNAGVNLPDKDITVVVRSDGSGTTWIFTNYLSKVSATFKDKVGCAAAVKWPAASTVAGKGNAGVGAYVKQVDGAIGYVEYAYAVQNKLTYTQLKNREGAFVSPTIASFQAAAAGADWAKAAGFYMVLTDEPGKKSWPITGASFILMYKQQADPAHAKEVLKFYDWSFKNGEKAATALDYVPLPTSVCDLVREAWGKTIKGSDGTPVWSK